jgi:hypothetical protein
MSYRDLYRMENQLTGFSVFEVLWQIQKLMTDRWIIFLLGQWSKIEKSGGMERCDVVHWKSKEDLSDFSGKLWLIGGDWNMNGLFFPVSWEFHHPNSWTHIFQDGYCTSNQFWIKSHNYPKLWFSILHITQLSRPAFLRNHTTFCGLIRPWFSVSTSFSAGSCVAHSQRVSFPLSR